MSTMLTLFVTPVLYRLLAAGTGSPDRVRQQLERELQGNSVAGS